MVLHRFGKGTKDDPEFGKFFLEGRGHRNTVEHRINRHPRQCLLLFKGNAQLLIKGENFGIDLLRTFRPAVALRRGVIDDILIIDGREFDIGPERLLHGLPVTESLEPPFEHELWFMLPGRDTANNPLIQPLGQSLCVDIRYKTVFVFLIGQRFKLVHFCTHSILFAPGTLQVGQGDGL